LFENFNTDKVIGAVKNITCKEGDVFGEVEVPEHMYACPMISVGSMPNNKPKDCELLSVSICPTHPQMDRIENIKRKEE